MGGVGGDVGKEGGGGGGVGGRKGSRLFPDGTNLPVRRDSL